MPRSPFPYHVPGSSPGDEVADLETLEALVRDLRRYAEGRLPSDGDLAAAPLVERWAPVLDLSAIRFAGLIVGHPRIGSRDGVTSRVHAVDRDRRWIRTYSRLWRLGDPAGPDRDGLH